MVKKLWTNGFWLMCCMGLLLASGLLGNGGASAAVDYPPMAGAQGLALDPDRGVESFRSVLWGWEIENRHNKQLCLQQKITAVR